MTIVCTTDFSPPASDAMAVASDIAKKRGETLLLWHAVEPPMGDPIAIYAEPLRTECAARLETDADRIRATGVVVETKVVVGYPDEELPASMPADATLIVAGARGHRYGTHWLIGSVAERVARVTTVPMLLVRHAETLRNWLNGMRKLNVVVATDLSAVSDFALRRTGLLRELGDCNLELLYIEYPPADYARLGVGGPICVHRPHPLVDDVVSRELAHRAETVGSGGNVTTRIAKTLGQTGAFIALEAEEAGADLVVVGAHQRRALARAWHGSIAHGVLHSVDTNVLLVPFHTSDEDLRALETVPLKTIVAATDFSPCGNRAVAWACSTARPETHVVIVNVIRKESETDESARQLERVKAALSPRNGARIDTVATIGDDAAATICATAERFAADLVIVGSHTRSRVSQLFAGSVSGGVLARSRRPVLVVPDPASI
jgi:nucleotide-binding universal stress UspA family protein